VKLPKGRIAIVTLRQRIEASLKEGEYIFDYETPLHSIRDMCAKGFFPVCPRCGTRLEFALSPTEAKEKRVAPGLRCPKDLRHCQVVVEFPRDANCGLAKEQ
jgi:hypothetical protein